MLWVHSGQACFEPRGLRPDCSSDRDRHALGYAMFPRGLGYDYSIMASGSRALQARFPEACDPPAAHPGRALAGGYANRALTGASAFALRATAGQAPLHSRQPGERWRRQSSFDSRQPDDFRRTTIRQPCGIRHATCDTRHSTCDKLMSSGPATVVFRQPTAR